MLNSGQSETIHFTLEDLRWVLESETSRALLQTGLDALVQRIPSIVSGAILLKMPARLLQVQSGELPAEEAHVFDAWQQAWHEWQSGERATFDFSPPSDHWTVVPMQSRRYRVDGSALFFSSTPLSQENLHVLQNLLSILAHYAHVLEENRAARRYSQRLELLFDITRALTETLDLQGVLTYTMQLAATAMDAEAASLLLADPQTNELYFYAIHSSQKDRLVNMRLQSNQGIVGWVYQNGEAVICDDPANDPRFSRTIDERSGFVTRNILCVPLQVKGKRIGVLEVLNKHGDESFTEEDKHLLMTLAAEAAIAIENARLYQNLREERDRIMRIQEDVRRELARTLHDTTVQLLSSIVMSVGHAQKLYERAPEMLPDELRHIEDLAQRAMLLTRKLLFELRPVVLETRGLGAALEAYIQRLDEVSRTTRFTLDVCEELPDLPQHVAQTIFAIVQEAINNAIKHAEATTIHVQVDCTATGLEVLVEDDGKGFDLKKVQQAYDLSGSLGLINMYERANLIEASITIESEIGQGTRVRLVLPYESLDRLRAIAENR
nr:GAF domain-containing sensor histidine kinase [Ardenticatena sp.]